MMRCFLTFGLACALLGSLAGCGFGTDDTLTTADLTRAADQGTQGNPLFNPLPDPDNGLTPAQIAAFKPERMTDREFAFAYDCFLKTNAYRLSQNPPLGVLTWNKHVAAVAFGHAQDQMTKGVYSHNSLGPNFTPCVNLTTANGGICIAQRLQQGFPTPVPFQLNAPGSRGTENIAWQTAPYSADQAMAQFIGSPTHKLNLDDPNVTQLGVGYVEAATGDNFIYVQVFYDP